MYLKAELAKGGFPGGPNGKESACYCRRCKRPEFDPWDGKFPWRRAWQPTPVFLPEESHGQRSLVGYSPQGSRVTHNWAHTQAKGKVSILHVATGYFHLAVISNSKVEILNLHQGDFPGGPVAKTPLPMQGVQVQCLVRESRFHMPHGQKTQNIKQNQYCNKFNKDFKNSPHQKKS